MEQKVFFLLLLNGCASLVHAVNGILGLILVADNEPQLDVVANLVEFHHGTLLTFIPKTIFKSRLLTPGIAVEWITAGFHILYIFQLAFPRFQRFLDRYVIGTTSSLNPTRWWEYAVTASLMSAFGAFGVGIDSFYYFVKALSNGVALQMCGYILELLDCDSPRDKRLASIVWNLATALNLTSVGIMLYHIFASKTHTDVFYYNVVPFALWFNTFGIVAWLTFKRSGPFADKYFSERWYIVLSLTTKHAVFWLSFSTYRGILEDNGVVSRTPLVNWTAVRYLASYGLMVVVIALGVYDGVSWQMSRRRKRKVAKDTIRPVYYAVKL